MSQDLFRVVRVLEDAPRLPSFHVARFDYDTERSFKRVAKWQGMTLCEWLIDWECGDALRAQAGHAFTSLGAQTVFFDLQSFGDSLHCTLCEDELMRLSVLESKAALREKARVSA